MGLDPAVEQDCGSGSAARLRRLARTLGVEHCRSDLQSIGGWGRASWQGGARHRSAEEPDGAGSRARCSKPCSRPAYPTHAAATGAWCPPPARTAHHACARRAAPSSTWAPMSACGQPPPRARLAWLAFALHLQPHHRCPRPPPALTRSLVLAEYPSPHPERQRGQHESLSTHGPPERSSLRCFECPLPSGAKEQWRGHGLPKHCLSRQNHADQATRLRMLSSVVLRAASLSTRHSPPLPVI